MLQLRVLQHPSLEEMANCIADFEPNLVYCFGGIEPAGDLLKGTLKPLKMRVCDEGTYEGDIL